MKNLFTALLLAGAATTAHAQTKISVGPRLGANLSSFSTSGANAGTTKSIFSGQFGAALDINFGGFSFQPALLYTQKGSELNYNETQNYGSGSGQYQYTSSETVTIKATPRINYLEIPLNLVYTSASSGFQVFAGPYLAFGMGGNMEYNYQDTRVEKYGGSTNNNSISQAGTVNIDFADKYPDPNSFNAPPTSIQFRKFDAGLNGGIGYRRGPVQAQLGYSLGLSNLIPNDNKGQDVNYTAKNRSIQLAATYFFDLSK